MVLKIISSTANLETWIMKGRYPGTKSAYILRNQETIKMSVNKTLFRKLKLWTLEITLNFCHNINAKSKGGNLTEKRANSKKSNYTQESGTRFLDINMHLHWGLPNHLQRNGQKISPDDHQLNSSLILILILMLYWQALRPSN